MFNKPPMTEDRFVELNKSLMQDVYMPALENYINQRVEERFKQEREVLWTQFVTTKYKEMVDNLQRTIAFLTTPTWTTPENKQW